MFIDARATCKYLKHRDKSKADIRDSCLSLKLVATRPDDVKILAVLYNYYIHGGTLKIEVPKREMGIHAEKDGENAEKTASDVRVPQTPAEPGRTA